MGEQDIVDLKFSTALRDMVDSHGDLTIDDFPETIRAAADRLDAQEARIAELEEARDGLRATLRNVNNNACAYLLEIKDLKEALRGLQGATDKLLTAMTFAEEDALPFGSFAEQCAKTETALATVRNLIGKPTP